jgi:hypothetical protein
MTPENILASLVAHGHQLDYGRPDPLIMEARADLVGKTKPVNWSVLTAEHGIDPRLLVAIRSADGSQSRSGSTHSVAEVAADALVGMSGRSWNTIQVAVGMSSTARASLQRSLARVARQLQQRERIWPDTIRRQCCSCGRTAAEDYIPDLVELALMHLEQPMALRQQTTRAQWFGMSERNWHRVAARPFDQVAAHLWSWYFAGIGHIQGRLRRRNQ